MVRGNQDNIFRYWGKAERIGNGYHPAVCHMLDVGIVARELSDILPFRLNEQILSIFGPSGASGLAFLAALHDIGKISPGFQMKREDLCAPLKEMGLDFPRYAESKHGKVAICCLPEIMEQELKCSAESSSVLSQVIAAHHGTFVGYGQVIAGDSKWDRDRRDTVNFLAKIFNVDSLEGTPLPSTADALLIAGLLTLADWLGSSEKHFPFVNNANIDIDTYISNRSERAKALIRELGMDSVVTTGKSFDELFPFSPNPCQEAILKVASRLKHPMLVVVESPMGTGKTEAAQAAFSQLASQNALRGMYYALPTQATGNAMFPRMRSFLENLDLTGQAELHLLHANADLNPDYEALKLCSIEDEGGSVDASSWFTARKRGVLASYGTGTIDQALMAVLKVRHFFLRLFGLSGKLLVLDEVHAYDAYMTEEIFRLIAWLSQCNTSMILLSATLPQARRKKLLEAFFPGTREDMTIGYPCVIGVGSDGNAAWEEIKGLKEANVAFSPVVSSQEEKAVQIVKLLKEKLVDGGCAACILNTVSDAQAVYEAVKREIVDADSLILFHSRFTLERRLEIEKNVLSLYAKNGSRPKKGIVIATQVLEQSLDVDFDIMISDLAPVDLLLQRAGRLHRHVEHDNFRPPLLRERILYVLMPDIGIGTPNFGGSKYVYFPDILLKTAHLFSNGIVTINLPYGVSAIIEKIYGNEDLLVSEQMQQALDKWVEERIGTEMANQFAAKEAALADVRSCHDDPSYLERLANDNDDEKMISSRLGRKNVTIIVMEDGETLSAQGKDEIRRLYAKSIVTDNIHLVRHFIDQSAPDEWKEVALLRHCHPLTLKDGKATVGNRTVSYDKDFGLRIIKNRG